MNPNEIADRLEAWATTNGLWKQGHHAADGTNCSRCEEFESIIASLRAADEKATRLPEAVKLESMNDLVLLLKLRSAVIDKEFVVACATYDTTRYGEWRCDWNTGMRECQASIEALTRQLAEEKERADHLQVCLTQDNDKLDALTRQRDGLRKLLEESMNVFLHIADCFKSSAAEHMAKKLKAALESAKETNDH